MQAPPGLEKEPQLMTSRVRRNETLLGQCDVAVQNVLLRHTNVSGQFSHGKHTC
jgi:hypothetical protein